MATHENQIKFIINSISRVKKCLLDHQIDELCDDSINTIYSLYLHGINTDTHAFHPVSSNT